ncbi:M17 family metallopeptidase [Paraferrimonas sedimenticola]|uniref:Peptidase M17 n=1 Tax=Paraferrimonas sedimenticola TaxID=375674 RepID=A0AA37RY76_9GAMM|nr:leucyl aminopeptidase family protein [Paraferrimonas sedimenticola]GLP96917.1 peptidase M17 [Paraferrimonas sedimenticola]
MTQAFFQQVTERDQIFADGPWDALVVLTHQITLEDYPELSQLVQHAASVDEGVGKTTSLLLAPGLAGGRMVVAPVAKVDDPYTDVRVYADAAKSGIERAKASGAKRPLLVVQPHGDSANEFAESVAALGAAEGLWLPLEAREAGAAKCQIEQIGLLADDVDAELLNALESGRALARDLCGTDPERMAPPAFADWVQAGLADSGLNISVIGDENTLRRDYPLLSAVSRSSFAVERHCPRVVRIEYKSEGPIKRTILLAGKGVTYDTGGADLKVGGAMVGMSRDKGGAAAAAGLMKTLSMLKPEGLHVIAELGLVRNSIGSDCFVPDEIITSHAGVRVRIGNTDAEGRLVLADVMSHLKQDYADSPQVEMFSLATLTGHVVRAYGGYTAAVENRAARANGVANQIQSRGEALGEPLEISRLRPEDFDKIKATTVAEDILSANNAPSSVTARGHQFPAAFLVKASGVDETMPYTHLDIAGSAVTGHPHYGTPTATPMVGLLAYLLA